MVLKTRFFSVLAVLGAVSLGWAQDAPRPGEVTLPLKDYLALVETVERVEREKARQQALQEAPVAEVVEQKTSVVVGEKEGEMTAAFEVLVQGNPKGPVLLPFAGLAAEVQVRALGGSGTGGASVTAAQGGGVLLVAPNPGRYAVEVSGRVRLDNQGGVSRLAFAPVLAPVALTEIDLPADLSWTSPGGVVVEDTVAGGRRKVRLATRQGQAQTLEVRRKVDGGEAEKLLARTVVLTIVQLRPEGPRRHDVVVYEVARGSLASFTVDLPPGLAVEQAGTDEGEVVPVVESRRLTVHRRQQLGGTGYLVLSSTPAPDATLPVAPVVPQAEPRARYLAISSSVAADARPLPETSWSRVDLDDLPPMLRDALDALELSAAWRLNGKGTPKGETALAVSILPPARSLDTVVRLRETTTLITVDGTVLHRDRLTLRSGSGAGTALDVVLPATATLWSAQVDQVPVRPVERGGVVSVPLGFDSRGEPVVEVVSVLERAIPPGRSQLALDLPRIVPPVLEHRWRLLLPEGPRYRFRSGDLRPAPLPGRETPGVLTDRINVGGNERGQRSRRDQPAAPEPAPPPPPPSASTVPQEELEEIPTARDPWKVLQEIDSSAYYNFDAFEELRQGLVGGVKPLSIQIPETGKVLLLTGVLPPAEVNVELDVRAKR